VKTYRIAAPFLLAFGLSCFAQSGAGRMGAPANTDHDAVRAITVEDAVTAALESNPQIHAAVRRLTLAQSKNGTARSLDDPMLMVRDWSTPLSKPWDLNQAQLMVSVQQTLISKQKRDFRAKIAGDDVEIAASDLESLRQEVAALVRKACADLRRNAEEMKLHDRQSSLLKEALAAALAQYTTGRVPQADVLRAQMAVTRLDEHLIELEQEHDAAQADLDTLMGRRSDEAVEVAGEYVSTVEMLPLEEMERLAMEHRPELAGLRKGIARSQVQAQATRLNMKPDFTVGVGYMLMPSGSTARNAYMAELTMNLPALNRERHDGEANQADGATAVAEADLEARTATVLLEVRQAQIAVEAAEKRSKVYRDTLLPQAEAAFKSATAAYQNNRAEFSSLIESQVLLLDIQTALYKASADRDTGVAELERAIGAALPGPTSQERNSK
jgi:cobalt-zinc-cadmium efflux system outer membrane protein